MNSLITNQDAAPIFLWPVRTSMKDFSLDRLLRVFSDVFVLFTHLSYYPYSSPFLVVTHKIWTMVFMDQKQLNMSHKKIC